LLHGGVHPDRLVVAPAAPGKAVLVDQIRRLPGFLSLKSQYGAPKVVILPEADRMNVSAANSLLKTLEEPPGDSLMLLVAALPSRLPATIRSRCQSLHVPQPARPIALQWLRRQGLGDQAAYLLAAAEGRPLLALSLRESSLPERRLAVARALPDLAAGRCDPSALAEAWVETQPGPLPTLRCIMSVTRDALRQSFDGDAGSLENPDLAEFSTQLARSVSASDLARRLGESERLHTWLESPVVPRLQFEDLLLAWRDRDGTRVVTDGGVF
jgi:DNA polymerase-3 subunit delta'